MQNYEQLIEKIARVSGLSKEEIDRKVDAKCAKLSGLISKEGSAQIVASELGINFDNEKMKISELLSGMKRVNTLGKVIETSQIREFTTKSGITSKVMSMKLADETGNIRTVLWDTNHISLFENEEIKQGDVVEITNGSMRNDELHLGSVSGIKKSKENIDNADISVKISEKKISELVSGQRVKLRAVIAQIFDPRFFEVCPQCNKKAVNNSCEVHGNIIPLKRALLSVVLDDGNENIRAVMFNEQINNLGITDNDLNDSDLFMKKKEGLLGEEKFFLCNVRNNQLFNTTELIINGIEQVEIDKLIDGLR